MKKVRKGRRLVPNPRFASLEQRFQSCRVDLFADASDQLIDGCAPLNIASRFRKSLDFALGKHFSVDAAAYIPADQHDGVAHPVVCSICAVGGKLPTEFAVCRYDHSVGRSGLVEIQFREL